MAMMFEMDSDRSWSNRTGALFVLHSMAAVAIQISLCFALTWAPERAQEKALGKKRYFFTSEEDS